MWTAPAWQDVSAVLTIWSVRSCVRPLGAVHMTAGLMKSAGTGSIQAIAFDYAEPVCRILPFPGFDRFVITS